jgi:polyhydroxyalkanoate synthesis regulator phasin
MSYTEARSHFENAKNNTADLTIIEIANGLKHLSHALEEDIRTLEQDVRDLQNHLPSA